MSRNYAVLIAVVLGASLVVSGVVLADLGSDPVNAATTPDSSADVTTIHVSASGSAAAHPDKVVVRLAVEATSSNASVARENVAENVSDVRTALTDLGLSAEQIRTADYNLYQDQRRVPGERSTEERAYRVSHQLVVETDDVEAAGEVIDAAVANGATSIYEVQFTLNESTRQALRSDALSTAMDRARNEAETLAASANVSIAHVDRITTTGGVRVYQDAGLTATAAAGGASTDFNAGPVSVTASVQVTYNATA